MTRRLFCFMVAITVAILCGGVSRGESDLCNQLDMKPVLSLDQLYMADLVDYIVQIDPNLERPEASSPEDLYRKEVELLIAAGYPAIFQDYPPNMLVTRRLFAQIMFQVAINTDPEFAANYSSVTNETEMLQALIDEAWLYSKEGEIYRDEILQVLCSKLPGRGPIAVEIIPVQLIDAELDAVENVKSPI